MRPCIGTAGMRADSHIADHADVHAGGTGGLLRLGQLLVQQPLDPGVEPGPLGQRPRRGQPRSVAGVGEFGRPAAPVRAVHLGQRAPACPGREFGSLALGEPPVAGFPLRWAPGRTDEFECEPFGCPDPVPVDQVRRGAGSLQRLGELVDVLPLRRIQVLVLRDVFDPQVQRAQVPTAHRQVRGVAHRADRLGRVQRVDQDEAGAELASRPAGQVGQVVQVAVAPGAARPDRVQLDGQPPGPLARQLGPDRGPGRAGAGRPRS